MKEKYPKYLPIGSVVLLENATKRLMITGFAIKPNEEKNIVYDYSGCLYPEGILTSDSIAVFNHDQIKQIFALGFSDAEEKEFKEKLNEVITKSNN